MKYGSTKKNYCSTSYFAESGFYKTTPKPLKPWPGGRDSNFLEDVDIRRAGTVCW